MRCLHGDCLRVAARTGADTVRVCFMPKSAPPEMQFVNVAARVTAITKSTAAVAVDDRCALATNVVVIELRGYVERLQRGQLSDINRFFRYICMPFP